MHRTTPPRDLIPSDFISINFKTLSLSESTWDSMHLTLVNGEAWWQQKWESFRTKYSKARAEKE